MADKRYDVGILGVWMGCNYGSIMTYFALNQTISSLGYSVLMIDKMLPANSNGDVEHQMTHSRRFANEHYNIAPALKSRDYNKLNDLCNTFVIGSDQCWNYGISKSAGKSFYLDFASDEKKKIAYATSFGHGVDFAPDDERVAISKLMKRFDGISLREDDGVRLCRDVYGVDSVQVLDPVFLVDPEKTYRPLIERSSHKEDEPFIAAYILDPTPEKREALLHVSEKLGGIKIINMLDGLPWTFEENRKKMDLPNCIENLQVEDWLYYLSHAQFVITDSCHGASFAMIFKKNFISITNRRRGFSRFRSLSDMFGFRDRLVTDVSRILTDDSLLEPIDYQKIDEIMSRESKRSIEWLEQVLSAPKKAPEGEKIYTSTVTAQLDIKLCTGCSACSSVCPKQAIVMTEDENGFYKPQIQYDKCVNCGLCAKKCIALNPKHTNREAPPCFAMTADEETRMQSSSGGMFTVAAEYILEQGGYVCGAAYTDNFRVEHIIINSKDELGRLRGSKYMQSHPDKVHKPIKELLDNGKLVLFTGMPCQVAGLYAFLGKDYDNLYTMDLLCHGITSSKVFDKYHRDVHGSKPLKHVAFKEKKPWGWHAGVNAYFTDGTHYAEPLERDKYFIAYLSSISKNTACASCKSNSLPRQGDITIGDFWGIVKYDPEMYDNKGTSLVLINNDRADAFFEALKPRMTKFKEESLEKAIQNNKIIRQPYPLNKNRDLFFEYFDQLDFASLTDGCKQNSLFDHVLADLDRKVPQEDMELYYLAKAAAMNCGKRQIVTWIRSSKFDEILLKYFGKKVAFGVTMRASAEKPETIKNFDYIKNKSKQFYLVSLDREYDENIYNTLAKYGYIEFRDFVFRKHQPIILRDFDLSKGNYHDDYGNTIEGFSGILKEVIFKGNNSHISLAHNVSGVANLTFNMGSNCRMSVGENTRFNNQCKVDMLGLTGSAQIVIGSDVRFREAELRTYNYEETSVIRVGNKCTFESNVSLHANLGKKIIIGEDCMFSYNITMFSGDGHSIFDVKTGKCINTSINGSPVQNQIVLGDHVWIGYNAFLLNGTNIGTGSIVGSESLVKGIFPNNCTVAGNPAKIVKTDVAWSRQATEDISRCGKDYVRRTISSQPPVSGQNVLVIGGTRFMGIQLVKRLIATGNNVTIATRGSKKDEFGSMVHRLTLDVTDEASVKKALSGKYFDVVFDNLAYCSANANNILSNVKCGRYIQLSSVGTYAPDFHLDMKESDFDPMNIPSRICDYSVSYGTGKRQAEAYAYQKFPHIPITTVRIPYVTPTDRLYYYCKNIVSGTPMAIKDVSRGFTFIRESEVGAFLPWIAGQNFTGPINLASKGYVTIQSILSYIEKKVGKTAVIDNENGKEAPFKVFKETTFSMNLDKAESLGYHTSNLHDWFWDLMDQYIEKALKETK